MRLRAATTKTRQALWVELHPALADALEATLGPREDRDPDGPPVRRLAAPTRSARRSRRRAGPPAIPLWSPHDLRHRRISLLHLRGIPWARIGEFVGQRDLTVTANTYTHVLVDEAELDYARLLTT